MIKVLHCNQLLIISQKRVEKSSLKKSAKPHSVYASFNKPCCASVCRIVILEASRNRLSCWTSDVSQSTECGGSITATLSLSEFNNESELWNAALRPTVASATGPGNPPYNI